MRVIVSILALLATLAAQAQVSVVREGVEDTDGAGGTSGSFPFTVDANAQLVVIYVTGFAGTPAAGLFSQLNFDNGADLDFTHIISAEWLSLDVASVSAFYMNNQSPDWPGPGNHTIYWSVSANGEGVIAHAISYENVDISSPTSSIGQSGSANGGTACNTMANMGPVGVDDLSNIVVNVFGAATAANVAPAGSGQTTRHQVDLVNNVTLAVGEKYGESQMRQESNPDNNSCIQFSIVYAEAPVGGPSLQILRRRGR